MAALRAGLSSQLRDRRLGSQLLSGEGAPSVEAVVRHLLAVQAQDLRGARLAVRARSVGPTATDFDSALDGRSLVISWLCRGTLHLVSPDDYFWLHDLCAPPLRTSCLRRLAQEGVSPDQLARATELIAEWLAEDGPLTRDELAGRLRSRRIAVAGQALVHMLFHATLEGLIIRGPMKGRRQAFVLVHDWLGSRPRELDRTQALAELARRYLAGHAPAAEHDLARWAGLPLRDIRAGLAVLGAQVRERSDGLLELPGQTAAPRPPRLRLLGAFDPLLVGWKEREFVTAGHDAAVISGGVFRPSILVAGRVGGTWRLEGRKVRSEPFEPLTNAQLVELGREVEAVVRYLQLAQPRLAGSARA